MCQKKKKLLFIVPYVRDMLEGLEELGICCIASFMRQNGNDVMLISGRKETINFDKIVSCCPDIVGFPVYDTSKDTVYELGMKIKQLVPGVSICIGGTKPTYDGEAMMREAAAVDYVIRGEGELAFLSLVTHLEKGLDLKDVKGLIYRDGPNIITNDEQQPIEDINILPFPARDILQENKLNIAQISTSRGCMGKCSFCSSQLFWKKWRGRTVKNIVDEIESIVARYNVRMFTFIDSSFEDPGVRHGRIKRIAEEIIRRNIQISYFADFRAEFHQEADQELIDLLKHSGLISAMIGIEAGNANDLRIYNKKASLEDNKKTIELLKNNDIIVKCGFINFNPYSTFEGLKQNIDFLEKYGYAFNLECIATKYVMFKGTGLYNRIVKDSLMKAGEDGEVSYNFVDSRIEPLADYVCNYMRQSTKIGDAFKKIRFFNVNFLSLIACSKHLFNNNEHMDAYKIVEAFEKENKLKIDRQCGDINNRAAMWFRELVALAENGWNSQRADEISDTYLNSDYVQETADSLIKLKNRLYMNLSRLGPNYCEYLPKIN